MFLVIIHDLDFLGACIRPAEAKPILIIYADAVLTDAVALQPLQPVARWNAEIVQPIGDLQLPELATRNSLDVDEAADTLTTGQKFSIGATK